MCLQFAMVHSHYLTDLGKYLLKSVPVIILVWFGLSLMFKTVDVNFPSYLFNDMYIYLVSTYIM